MDVFLLSFDVGWFGGCFEFGAFLSNLVQWYFEFDAIRCCSSELIRSEGLEFSEGLAKGEPHFQLSFK